MAGDYEAGGPMLDSRRDCRYRLVAHLSIRVGLGNIAFHDVLGISSGGIGFTLTLVHPSV